MNRKKKRLIVVGILILIFGVVLFYVAMGSSSLYYKEVDELLSQPSLSGKQVRVAGSVVEGSLKEKDSTYNFDIADGKKQVHVTYKGTIPSGFKEKAQVIVEGTYLKGKGIEAKTLITRCPSKFVPR